MRGFFKRVYKIVQKIPSGRVLTYGRIAKMIGTRDARKVGFALHANKSNKIPCHRVVNKEGKLASNFSFGGSIEQQLKLESEGIKFTKDGFVDLTKYAIMDI